MITADPGRITVAQGTLLELTVEGDELDSVSLLDQIEPIEPRVAGDLRRARRQARRVPDRAGRRGPRGRDARRRADELGARRARRLRVVPGLVRAGALAPRARHRLRRAAEAGDHLAGTAAGGAALRIVGVGRRGAHGRGRSSPGRAERPTSTRAGRRRRRRATGRPGGRSGARGAASAAPRGRSAAAAGRTGGTRSRPCSCR